MMKNWLVLAALLGITITTGAQESAPPLRELAAQRDMYIGAAINTGAFANDSAYLETAVREFNIVTPENMLKFGPLSIAQGRYRWRDPDRLVEWAGENDMRVHGHVLVWHNQLPDWLIEDNFSAEELEAILEAHIKTVVGRYKGRIHEWDVVNEAIDDGGGLRDTIWLRAMGPEYIAKAFRWAHEADPAALLYYNDYNADLPGRKADAIYELVTGLLEDGVPIHGVGLQAHLAQNQRNVVTAENIREVMDRLGELGLRVAITELDVRIHHERRTRDEMLDIQARMYGEVARACLEAPNCDTIVTWGVSDQYSWIPGFTGHDDWPLLFDEDFNPKPAYDAMAGVLSGADSESEQD